MLGKTLYQPIVDKETGEIILQADIVLDEEVLENLDEKAVFGENEVIEVKVKNKDGEAVKNALYSYFALCS